METNALAGPDEIFVPEGRYRLTLIGAGEGAGDLDVLDEVSISGAGSRQTVVDAGRIDRVLEVHSLAAHPSLGTVRISDLTLENGQVPSGAHIPPPDAAAGLRAVAAAIELTRVSISRNDGGGVSVSGLGFGGGLALSVGFELLDSTVETNSGTGIVLRDVTGSLRNSVIRGNGGWGIDHQGGQVTTSRMAYSSSLVAGNSKGGLKLLDNSANTYVGMRITDNAGPGINYACVDCHWHELRDSEISRNRAQEGGGLLLGDFAAMRVTNSTISGNTALRGGGVSFLVDANARLELKLSTVTDNEAQVGGGLATIRDGNSISLLGSVLAGNRAATGPDCAVDGFGQGAIEMAGSLGYSGLGTMGVGAGRCFIAGGPGDLRDIDDPGLLALAANGGPTLTHATRPDSVLLERVPIGSCSEIADQRGVSRPQGALCDIGAYERAAACADGIDNDQDGASDFPDDPDCFSLASGSEAGAASGPSCGLGPELLLLAPLLGRARRYRWKDPATSR